MMNKKINALCLFDYGNGVHTGYATVSRNLVDNWKKTFGDNLILDIIAINYYGLPYNESETISVDNAYYGERPKEDRTKINFPQMVKGNIKNDEFGRLKFLNKLNNGDYDLIFILNDLGIISSMTSTISKIKADKLKSNRKSFKSVIYFPVDSHVFDKVAYGLQVFDSLVTFTQFGKNEMLKIYPSYRTKLSVIPHGTNLQDFRPLDYQEISEFRRYYFGENSNKFIIGNINRNQSRKDIPATILAFMEFLEYNPDSLLYLHMNPEDPLGHDLRLVLAQTPLVEGVNYMFPSKEKQNHGASIEELNKIYNAIDVYVTTNMGEGWGLSITEAMRCKKPVIAPIHTSIEEISLYGKNIWGLEKLSFHCNMNDNIIRYKCDESEVCQRLKEVYHASTMEKDAKINGAYNFISSLTWEKSALAFSEIFKKLLKIK